MTQYGRGRQFEYRVRAELERAGYTVFRSAGSKSPADLVALSAGCLPVLVQCKIGGHVDRHEWNALFAIATACGAVPVLALRIGRKLYWRVILAERKRYQRVGDCSVLCNSIEEVLCCASAKART